MVRLLDGLAVDQKLTMNYLMRTWEDHPRASAIDVFKVGPKLTNDLGTKGPVLSAASVTGEKQGKSKTGEDKCP